VTAFEIQLLLLLYDSTNIAVCLQLICLEKRELTLYVVMATDFDWSG
jgi:hypothetical protein